MKNILKLFGVFCFSILTFFACYEDDQTLTEFDVAIQEYIVKAQNGEFKPLPVERITLEELNEIFAQNGIDPVTQEELALVFRTCDAANCDAIASYGDINDSGTISAADLVIANTGLSNCDSGSNGLDAVEIANCSQVSPHNSRLWLAGHAVHSGTFGSNTIFDECDYNEIRNYILGLICT